MFLSDKTLVRSAVAAVATLLGFFGAEFVISEEEQLAIVEGVTGLAVAALGLTAVGRALYLRFTGQSTPQPPEDRPSGPNS